ncbi:hypothetical protein LCGC14_1828740, partial [marine sediment metagenome]
MSKAQFVGVYPDNWAEIAFEVK